MSFAAGLCVLAGAAPVVGATTPQPQITLEKIMADPEWIGTAVKDPYWSADGRAVYYSAKRRGSPLFDLHRVDLAGHKDQVIDPKAMAGADGPVVFDRAGKRAAFARNGDIFVRDVAGGRLTQITRTGQNEAAPQFSADGRLLSFRVDNDWFVHDFGSGITAPAAVIKLEKDPDAAPAADDLRDMQLRTFSTLKRLHDEAAAAKKYADDMRLGDATRAAAPFYLGDDVIIRDAELSPDARWLIIVTVPKSAPKGMEGKLTRYVTESGYEEFETERLRVGRNPPVPQSLLLLNLADHSVHALGVDTLPGIGDDPLKSIREENGTHALDAFGGKAGKPGQRGVLIVPDDPEGGGAGAIAWSDDGKELAIQLLASDNKDRWIATVDFANYSLVSQHRLTDPAWVGWTFNEMGWLNDNRTLWYESEESGFAHLYTKAPHAEPKALTHGRFEVSEPTLSEDGRWFYVLSNAQAPGSYDVYRVPSSGGELQRVTQLQGVEKFVLDGSGKQLLVTHSQSYIRDQIAVLKADGSGGARELNDTRSEEYKAFSWHEPEIVKIPSTHFDGVIYAKLYRDVAAATSAKRPAVMFIHGAGYMQNVHLHYPYYFREQMFNSWLVQQGLCGARHGLPRLRGLWARLAHGHLSPDGPSGIGGPARRQEMAGGAAGGGCQARRRVRRFIRRLHDPDGAVPGARGIRGRGGAAPRHGLDAVREQLHVGHPQRSPDRPDCLQALLAHRICRRPARPAAHLPRRHRRQCAVRGFDAPV